MELDQLKVIVTGGASGLGEHFAKQLLAAGAQVAVGDVNQEGLDALPDGIHRRKLNVADQDDIASFVPWAAEQMGGLNGLINNAGIIRDGLWVGKSRKTGEIRRMSREDWDLVIAINLTGAALMVQEVVAHMIEHGEPGVIVNISSIARHGNRGQSNYVAAKAALAANTRTWMKEFAPYGIRVAWADGTTRRHLARGEVHLRLRLLHRRDDRRPWRRCAVGRRFTPISRAPA
jgi:3-oxoacyl-[acyl-carrier protein] reductase